MPAGVARALLFERLTPRHRCLRQPGQGVELGEYADHRLAAARTGDESRGNVGDPGIDVEAALAQMSLQAFAALFLQIAQLSQRPDFLRKFLGRFGLAVHSLDHRFGRCNGLVCGQERRADHEAAGGPHESGHTWILP